MARPQIGIGSVVVLRGFTVRTGQRYRVLGIARVREDRSPSPRDRCLLRACEPGRKISSRTTGLADWERDFEHREDLRLAPKGKRR